MDESKLEYLERRCGELWEENESLKFQLFLKESKKIPLKRKTINKDNEQ